MAGNYCTQCGASNSPEAKFCSSCGKPIQPQEAAQYPSNPQQVPRQQASYAQPAQPAQKQKKTKGWKIALRVVIGVAAAAAVAIGILQLMGGFGGVKDGNFYEISGEKVPSVSLALDESRKARRIEHGAKNDVKTLSVDYDISGNGQSADMREYFGYLCGSGGFTMRTAGDPFTQASGTGIQAWRNSKETGYMLIIQADWDAKGYTITVMYGPGSADAGLNTPSPSTPPSAPPSESPTAPPSTGTPIVITPINPPSSANPAAPIAPAEGMPTITPQPGWTLDTDVSTDTYQTWGSSDGMASITLYLEDMVPGGGTPDLCTDNYQSMMKKDYSDIVFSEIVKDAFLYNTNITFHEFTATSTFGFGGAKYTMYNIFFYDYPRAYIIQCLAEEAVFGNYANDFVTMANSIKLN